MLVAAEAKQRAALNAMYALDPCILYFKLVFVATNPSLALRPDPAGFHLGHFFWPRSAIIVLDS